MLNRVARHTLINSCCCYRICCSGRSHVTRKPVPNQSRCSFCCSCHCYCRWYATRKPDRPGSNRTQRTPSSSRASSCSSTVQTATMYISSKLFWYIYFLTGSGHLYRLLCPHVRFNSRTTFYM